MGTLTMGLLAGLVVALAGLGSAEEAAMAGNGAFFIPDWAFIEAKGPNSPSPSRVPSPPQGPGAGKRGGGEVPADFKPPVYGQFSTWRGKRIKLDNVGPHLKACSCQSWSC